MDMEDEQLPPIIKCLSKEDQSKIMDYIPYISCDECKNLMLSPKFCSTCKKNYCDECKSKCKHDDLKPNRHINSILEKINITCKFNCGKDPFPLSKLLEHIKYCDYKKYYYSNEIEDEIVPIDHQKFEDNFSQIKEVFKPEELLLLDFDSFIKEIEEKKVDDFKMKCYKCSKEFNEKIQFMKHFLECINKDAKTGKYTDENFEKDFIELREKLAVSFNSKIEQLGDLYLKEIEKTQNNLDELNKQKEEKEDFLKKLIEKNDKILHSKDCDEDLFAADEEYKTLKNEEMHLKQIKEKLLNELDEKNKFLRGQIYSYKNDIELGNAENIAQLTNLSKESKILFELISNFSTSVNGACFICKDEKSEKFICTFCKKKFCKNKCAKKCKNENCVSLLCPDCTGECKLCHKKIYCDNCKKNCFSSSCKNKFCIECYERNAHQIRETYIDCKFFICNDDEHTNDCLMTTLYCPKCEKRKCNKCLLKDKEHYASIKLFD